MVKRKSVNAGANRASSGLPYPTTSISPKETIIATPLFPTEIEGSPISSGNLPSNLSSSNMASSTSAWADDDILRGETSSVLPSALKVGDGGQQIDGAHRGEVLLSSLRVGPMDDTPRSSFESQKSARLTATTEQVREPNEKIPGSTIKEHHSKNPYLHMRDTNVVKPQGSFVDGGSSVDIWADIAGSSSANPLGAQHPNQILDPEASDSSGGFSERSPFTEPWVDLRPSPAQDVLALGLASQPTSTEQECRQIVGNPYLTDRSESYTIGGFGDDIQERRSTIHELRKPQESGIQIMGGTVKFRSEGPSDAIKRLPPVPLNNENRGPDLPPRISNEVADAPPLRPQRPEGIDSSPQPEKLPPNQTNSDSGRPQLSEAEKQQNKVKKQRSETYQIRLVNWYDTLCSTKPRRSPIMVQNANGPCPLLALVNALVLSTPADVETALVETLRVREQVSLGLLLDAVIDELMSGRRGDAAQDLPDVSDLYAFLITLHTGMNVNPRFVPLETEMPHLMDAPVSESQVTLRESVRPGGFEDTREMGLYSTFAIPLIHGWLSPRNHAAFAALQRSAKTYEDAQNLMFMEEELEDKLQRQGLTPQEQLLLEDVGSVKYFLSSSATQLTGYGLDIMTDALLPGSIAILFRNDHFSTLYRHPHSGKLFTLVTDMGYAGHDEVVWESLVDISGEGCEFFAGDFRSVGHNTGKQPVQSNAMSSSDNSGWTTVSRSNNSNRSRQSLPSNGAKMQDLVDPSATLPKLSSLSLGEANEMPTSPNTEQEDHDLALALQLQEEEEDRERREIAARRREDELSQAYLEAQGPSARRGPVRASEVRPIVPPRGTRAAKQPDTREEAPPPTYEQAAKVPAYHPPGDDALAFPGRNGSSVRPQGARQRGSSAYSQNAAAFSGSPPTHNANFVGPSPLRGNPRRRSSGRGGMSGGFEGAPGSSQRRNGHQGAGVVAEEEDKKDCIVM